MDPLEASWLIRACAVLHNMCIDWGMQSLKPRDAHDPEIELQIQTEAANRFLRVLRAARNRNGPRVKRLQRKRDDNIDGLNRRPTSSIPTLGVPGLSQLSQNAGVVEGGEEGAVKLDNRRVLSTQTRN